MTLTSRPFFMIVWNLEAAALNTEDEHIEITGTEISPTGFTIAIRAPVLYEEMTDADMWRNRLSLRFESYDLPCSCNETAKCHWHQILEHQWAEDDADAIDSWRESRGDFDAMCRRTSRKIKAEAELDPDVL